MDKGMLQEWLMNTLVDWTRPGAWLRRGWIRMCLHSRTCLEALVRLDLRAMFRITPLPGCYIIEWPPEWSSAQMAGILAEKIRRAPRTIGLAGYMITLGEFRRTGEPEEHLAQNLRAFLDECRPERPCRLALLLEGEFYAAMLRQNNWPVRWERGRG
mgnify:CR=1 FL=1